MRIKTLKRNQASFKEMAPRGGGGLPPFFIGSQICVNVFLPNGSVSKVSILLKKKAPEENTTNLLKKGLLFKQSKRAEIGACVPALARAAKVLQHHLYTRGRPGRPSSAATTPRGSKAKWVERCGRYHASSHASVF